MPDEKIIVAIGLTDEATAHLRLLIRKAAAQLTHRWVWGEESHADLVVVDDDSLIGRAARTRARFSGLRTAVMCREDSPEPEGGLVLREPLKSANVVAVLNRAAAPTVAASAVNPHSEDFYFRDLAEFQAPAKGVLEASRDQWGDLRSSAPVAKGLEEHIFGDPTVEPVPDPNAPRITPDTAIEWTGSPATTRAERFMSDRSAELLPGARADPAQQRVPPTRRVEAPDTAERPLDAYLVPGLLGGPMQVQLGNAPALTLDPKLSVFHAAAPLSALEIYAQRPLQRGDFKTLTGGDLNLVRQQSPARPYAQLRWLRALLGAQGRLAAHLDPGGTYRLKEHFDAPTGWRGHHAIVGAMRKATPLNEIAAASGHSMAEVFDIVSAYDAVGLIEMQPRARFRVEEAPEPKGGLLGKIWPFKRP